MVTLKLLTADAEGKPLFKQKFVFGISILEKWTRRRTIPR